MSELESWMPSDEKICEVFPAMTYAQRSKVAIIAAFAVKRALAGQERKVRRATLQEAARAVCGDCGAGVQLLPQTAEWEYGHPDGEGYRYDCAAAPIHDLIAALEVEP